MSPDPRRHEYMQSWGGFVRCFAHPPVFKQLSRMLVSLGVYSAVIVILEHFWLRDALLLKSTIHGLLGLTLGLLLVFRTNTSYDRWWEGRKLWGQLVNDSRNFAIKVHAVANVDRAEKHEVARLYIAFAWALKDHLRHGVRLGDLEGFDNETDNPSHVPAYLARRIFDHLTAWKRSGQVDGFELLILERHATALMDICGACERIRKTPIADSYLSYIRQTVFTYIVTLPWALVHEFQIWTVPVVVLIGYFMIGIEILAEHAEEPFGLDPDDLALEIYCKGIQAVVTEIVEG